MGAYERGPMKVALTLTICFLVIVSALNDRNEIMVRYFSKVLVGIGVPS